MFRLSVLFLFASFSLISAQQVWNGVAYQDDADQGWAFEVEEASETVYFVNYYTLKCRGSWFIEKKTKRQIIAIERITEGNENCHNNSKIVILNDKVDKDSKRIYFYYNLEKNEKPNSVGTLKKYTQKNDH